MQYLYHLKSCCVAMKFYLPIESIYLKLFSFSLADQAMKWYNILQPHSITNWGTLVNKLLEHYFLWCKSWYQEFIVSYNSLMRYILNHGSDIMNYFTDDCTIALIFLLCVRFSSVACVCQNS